jgi:cytochrome c oxidase assembly factor CtaG
MFLTTVVLHSLLRWLVIAFGLVAVWRAISGVSGRRPWTPLDDRAGRLFVMAVDIQLLVGLILYGLLSPITRAALADMGTAMKDATLRFYAVEHLAIMLGAVALIHIGRGRARKASVDAAKHRTAAIFFTLGLLLILIGTPWPFRAIGRPLFPYF